MEMEIIHIQEVEETAGLHGEFLQASLEDQETKYQIFLMDSSSSTMEELEEEEGEDGPLLGFQMTIKSEDDEQSVLVSLPPISGQTEKEMMKVGRSYKKKKEGEDKSIETLAKKLQERFKDHDEEDFDIEEIAEEEEEDPKRIYDLLNIFEGLGLLKKNGKKTYSLGSQQNLAGTLENLKKSAIEVDLNSQISQTLKKTRVLQFRREEVEGEGGKTKEFHLKLLTEKILMIFLSSDSSERGNPSYSYEQIRAFVFNEDMKATKDSVQIKITRVLRTLVGLEILSRVVVGRRGRGRKQEVLYQLQPIIASTEGLEGEKAAGPEQHQDLLAVAMDWSLLQLEVEPVDHRIFFVDVNNVDFVLEENLQEIYQ